MATKVTYIIKELYTSPPGRPVQSDTNSTSVGSILATLQLSAKTKSLTFPPPSIARYSYMQLSEPGRQCRERKCPIFETVATWIRTMALPIAARWHKLLHQVEAALMPIDQLLLWYLGILVGQGGEVAVRSAHWRGGTLGLQLSIWTPLPTLFARTLKQ